MLPLANYHPAIAVAQVAMADHLVQGRLVFGVGPGVPDDAEVIGDLTSDRFARRSMELMANEVWPRIEQALRR